jgi:two-component system, OmpR family, response regulator
MEDGFISNPAGGFVRGRSQTPTIGVEVVGVRLLVVDDAARLLEILARRLREEGYAVDATGTGEGAVAAAAGTAYDTIVLDVRLPDMDGFEVCRRLRAGRCWSPVLMLTARDAVEDRVLGLDVGADDYLTKPFAFPELFARVRALVRRGTVERPPALVVGELGLDPAARLATRAGEPIELTAREFALLEYLMRHPNMALSRRRLIEHVWDGAYAGDSNIVDVYVRGLRGKIDRGSLQTVRGVGYRLCDPAAATDRA